MSKPKIVAYRERPSVDPETGATGTLREEWRVDRIGDWAPEALTHAFGPDWRRCSPFAEYLLVYRYVRRGVEEPWMPVQSTNTYKQAFGYLDSPVILVCPIFRELDVKQREAQEKARREQEEKERVAAEKQRAEQKEQASRAAFTRLAKSRRYAKWAPLWNDFVARHRESQALIAGDPETMAAYQDVMAATTVTAKASAIKRFLGQTKKLGLS